MGRDATLTGWAVEQLGSVTRTSSGTTPARALSDRYYRGGSVAWVKTMDLANTEIHETSERVTDLALKETSLTVYPAGTVLVAMYGGFQQIGRTGILRTPAAVNQAITAIQSNADRLTPEYLLATLNYRVDYWRSVASSSRKDPNITGNDVRAFPIALPTVEEQQKIGLALSDVDALLAGLDRLITKKRDITQAAMQQLLTGQIRLPGFESEWAEVRLRNIGTVYGGLTGKTKADFGAGADRYVTFVNVMSNVMIDHSLFEQVRVGPMESQNLVKSGDLLFNGSSETPEEVAMCSLVSGEIQGRLFLNSFCFGFRFHSGAETDALFLTYYLRSREGRELMKSLAQGSTRYNLSKGALLDSVLHMPSKAEQTAIAVVLSEMDAELLALEARLRKTRNLKEAMMQELLTGRIRLI